VESELSAASTALRLSTTIKAVVDDAFIDSTSSSSSSSSSSSTSSIRASKAVEEQSESSLLQFYHSNHEVVDEVVNRLQQRREMKDDVDDDDDDDDASKRKQVTWVELVHGGLPIDDGDGDDSGSKGKALDASPTCTSEELQVFDRWIERIHNAAQTGTFMMVITQGSLQPAKLLASQKLRSRWEQAAIRRKQALAGMLSMMIAAVMIMMACW
jgi:hypothetical protein